MAAQSNKESLIDMFSMRISGKSYAEIGSKYGTTRQNIEQLLKGAICEKSTSKKDRYPKRKAVAAYLDEHKLTVATLSEMCSVERTSLAQFMTGAISPTKTINKIIKATGLTYEQIMAEELE